VGSGDCPFEDQGKRVARTRTTKKLAQRIDLNYFKRPTPLKRAKFWLSLVLPLLALSWITWRGFSGDHHVYSSGRMSRAHAVLEKECAACHVQTASAFSAKAVDSACLDCHDGPDHHAVSPNGRIRLACAECHTEHRGRINISAANDQICAVCHANLKTLAGVSAFGPVIHKTHIRSFQDGHPEFAALQPTPGYPTRDPGTIKVNHAIHMKPIRRGPIGPDVQLVCSDCHRSLAAQGVIYSNNASPFVPPTNWIYADIRYLVAKPSYLESDINVAVPPSILPPYEPPTGREFMAPVSFAKACSGCHSLAFDKRFAEGVPHDKPEVVRAFLIQKFQQYIAAHPGEVRMPREPNRDLIGKTLPPEVRILTPAQWVAERTADAEELLWRKTCEQCHELRVIPKNPQNKSEAAPARGDAAAESLTSLTKLPVVLRSYKTLEWMPRAKFDHDAHRGFSCVSCHLKTLTSTESSDILLPGIATCQTCHAPGPAHADSRCSECHTYHDWSKRKEVAPKFTVPALRSGGQ